MDALNESMLFEAEDSAEAVAAAQDTVQMVKFLIFFCDDLKFGVDTEQVMEIINNFSITQLPMVPPFIHGIINLRGQIVPVVDIRTRLGKEPGAHYLVVLNIRGTLLAVLVDWVEQILDLPKSSILPITRQNAQPLVSGMCSLPDQGGAMLVLDCDQLLEHE